MASEEGNHSTEWVMVSDLVQCMLCFGTIKQPKVLPGCKHMFCFDCLLRWWEDSVDSNMNSVACPTCRVQCALPTEGISALPSDIRSSKLGEMLRLCVVVVNKEEKPPTTDSATGPGVATPPCDVCHLDTERDASANLSQAVKHCEDCGNYLCDSCSSKHDGTSVFAKHQVKDLRKTKHDPQILCSKHPGKPLQYLCRDCPSIACSICVTTQHLGHIVLEMKEMIDSHKSEIKNMLQDIKKMSEYLDNRMALTEELVMKTKDIYWAVAKKVADHADRCHKEIEEAENRLLEELEAKKNAAIHRTREQGNKRKYNITELDALSEYIEKFLASAEPLHFVSNCDEIVDKMMTILQSRDRGIIVDLQGVGTRFIVQQGLLSLGRLEDESASRMTLDLCKEKKPALTLIVPDVKSNGQASPKEKPSKDTAAKEARKDGESRKISGGRRSRREEARSRNENQKGSTLDFAQPADTSDGGNDSMIIAVASSRPTVKAPTKPQPSQNKFEFMPFLLEYCINYRSIDILKHSTRGRSNSSSTDNERQLMPHSGHPCMTKRVRSASLAERKNGLHNQRRHSIQSDRQGRHHQHPHHPPGEEREVKSRPTSMVVAKTDIVPVFEAREGPKLLWEAGTAEKTEAEPSRPRDVSFLSNGDVYVLNDSHHNLVHFTADGKTSQLISADFSSPMCVVVTKDDRPAVSDSQEHCIKMFSAGGASYSVWDLENVMASGVTITESGKWLVLDKIGDVLGIFPEPGAKCERHVPLTKHLLYTERYMACDSKGRIFVSGSADTAVAVFDPEGQHLMDIGGAGSQGGYVNVPRGLHVDRQDNLIVADRHNHRVSMFSPDGRFIRHVVTCPYDKVVWPTGIDFVTSETDGYKMAVTISDSVVQVYDVSLVI